MFDQHPQVGSPRHQPKTRLCRSFLLWTAVHAGSIFDFRAMVTEGTINMYSLPRSCLFPDSPQSCIEAKCRCSILICDHRVLSIAASSLLTCFFSAWKEISKHSSFQTYLQFLFFFNSAYKYKPSIAILPEHTSLHSILLLAFSISFIPSPLPASHRSSSQHHSATCSPHRA